MPEGGGGRQRPEVPREPEASEPVPAGEAQLKETTRATSVEQIERRWSREASKEVAPDLAPGWRAALAPGGMRLMARELVLDRLREASRGEPRRRSAERRTVLERVIILAELAALRIARLIVLRSAGLKAPRQRELARRIQL